MSLVNGGAAEKLKPLYRVHLHRHNAVKARVARRYEEYRARPAVRSGRPEKL